jgi:ABC-type multidrug transport system fused ATPase/permease subunit
VARASAVWLAGTMVRTACENLAERLRSGLFRAMLSRDIADYDDGSAAEKWTLLNNDVREYKAAVGRLVSDGVPALVTVVAGSYMLYSTRCHAYSLEPAKLIFIMVIHQKPVVDNPAGADGACCAGRRSLACQAATRSIACEMFCFFVMGRVGVVCVAVFVALLGFSPERRCGSYFCLLCARSGKTQLGPLGFKPSRRLTRTFSRLVARLYCCWICCLLPELILLSLACSKEGFRFCCAMLTSGARIAQRVRELEAQSVSEAGEVLQRVRTVRIFAAEPEEVALHDR